MTRSATDRCGAMCIAKNHALRQQAIKVRRPSLRVATEDPNPVVQVVNGNKQDIGPGLFLLLDMAEQVDKILDRCQKFKIVLEDNLTLQ